MARARRSLATEMLGRVRVAIASLRLRAFIRRNRRSEPAALFEMTWSEANRLGRLFDGLAEYRNRFRHAWRDILFLRVLRSLDRAGVRFVPKVAVRGFEIIRSAATKGPVIVVLVHSPVDAVINRLLDDAGLPWVLLASRAQSTRVKARLLGLAGALDVIPLTSDSLLATRRSLAQGRAVCACVDFTIRSEPGALFVSPALFDLAMRTGSAVAYAHTRVTDGGTIEVTCAAPRIDLSVSTPDALAEDFVAWLRDDQGDGRSRTVRKWVDARSSRRMSRDSASAGRNSS